MLRRGIHKAAQLDLTGMQLPFHRRAVVRAKNNACDEWKNARDEQHGKSVQPDNSGMRCKASIYAPGTHLPAHIFHFW
jgi:hypothetical protein